MGEDAVTVNGERRERKKIEPADGKFDVEDRRVGGSGEGG